MSNFDLGAYNDVASRMREFFDKYPEGRLRPAEPWRVQQVGERLFVVYSAAAYRTAEDVNPGVGTAWEPFPGKTNYTRDSELQNAETSAWGRAILAVGAADTRKGIASAEEVRNRQADREDWDQARPARTHSDVRAEIAKLGKSKGMKPEEIAADFESWSEGVRIGVTEDVKLLGEYLEHLRKGEP